ncbi:hypothetical protein F7725_022058 [Dissostichus mawsoni]|uniref:Uncharacterized protein n=1 Tax=Dissostichus mawsoni TaxID=36200 RepID=A0A7J5ZF71_DISMA|nr:hypothetical protein F7725_022058 [Dissostichus mawsoni]
MSGDGVHALASVSGAEELHFSGCDAGVVPPSPPLPPAAAPLRMELFRRMEFLFLREFWCDSSLFCSVWIKMEGFSSSSLALQRDRFVVSHLDGVPKLGVVHGVDAVLLRHYGTEAVSPLDLLGDVGGPGLSRDAGRLYDSFKDHDHLQVAALELHRRQVSDADHETQTVVSDGDDGVTAEDQSLRSAIRLSPLMMSPTMFCMMRTVMAVGQCSVIIRPPKPIVT